MKNSLEAKKLWGKLKDIPVDYKENIEKDFLHFKKGTNKFDIWHWFEEKWGLSVYRDLMFLN